MVVEVGTVGRVQSIVIELFEASDGASRIALDIRHSPEDGAAAKAQRRSE